MQCISSSSSSSISYNSHSTPPLLSFNPQIKQMLKTALPRSHRLLHFLLIAPKNFPSASATRRLFSQSATTRYPKDAGMAPGPPKHEMAYFPEMTSVLPSTSAEFRRVLWTGLYSQVVLMTVPVGGDIGDEVCFTFIYTYICVFEFRSASTHAGF